MTRRKRILLSSPLLVLILVVTYSSLSVGFGTFWRMLRWGNSDVRDYEKFPAREMAPASQPFRFSEAIDEPAVRTLFAAQPLVDDLEHFLEETGTQAFLVIQDDALLYERYFNGASRDTIVTSFSMAKSFASTLIGIAIEEGFIESVHDPISRYLPELAVRDQAFGQITIQDLLRMSSGIRYEELPQGRWDDTRTYYDPDLRSLALEETEIVGPPGEVFLYNNFHPLLLGLILERATGMAVADYLETRIWQPMGAAYAGSWSLDGEDNGFEKMESGINGRAIDFAKFGVLFLHEGNWQGTQVVPAAWVREATAPDLAPPADGYYNAFFESLPGAAYYQYMWWGYQRGPDAYDFAAEGNHGQFIYVSPAKKLVIVRHGERYGAEITEWINLFYGVATAIPAP